MKSNSIAIFLLAGTAFGQSYQPPTLSSVDPIFRTGITENVSVTIGRGSVSTPSVLLHYSGAAQFTRTAFSGFGGSTIQVNFPAPLIGSYQLDAVELSDSGGDTIFHRDGTITRALYNGVGLPTTHSVNLSVGDFSVGGAQPSAAETGRAINLSTRGFVGAGDQAMIVGLVVSNGTKSFLFRAIGPALGGFGVTGFVPNPKIELKNAAGSTIASNDDWTSDLIPLAQSVGAFPLAAGSRDAALRATLTAGSYTLVITSADANTGIALAEAYELP